MQTKLSILVDNLMQALMADVLEDLYLRYKSPKRASRT